MRLGAWIPEVEDLNCSHQSLKQQAYHQHPERKRWRFGIANVRYGGLELRSC